MRYQLTDYQKSIIRFMYTEGKTHIEISNHQEMKKPDGKKYQPKVYKVQLYIYQIIKQLLFI